MNTKIIIPLLAASLLATGCTSPTSTPEETKVSQQSMSKADMEKIDQQTQKIVESIKTLYKNKTYVKEGYFSEKEFPSIKYTLNLYADAFNVDEKVKINDGEVVKSLGDHLLKKIDGLSYKEKKKFLSNLKQSSTYYNAIYREKFYQSLYEFDKENNIIDNEMDSFINYVTSDGVKQKDATEYADMKYDFAKIQVSYWEEEAEAFQEKYGKNFSAEEYDTVLLIMKNFKEIEKVRMLFVNNLRMGVQVKMESEEALDKIDSLYANQIELFETLNDSLNISEDLSYDEYVLNHD